MNFLKSRKLTTRHILIWLMLVCFHQVTTAQIDTIFWFSAPEISASLGDNPISLRILSYDNPSTVTISQPANGSFTPIVISLPAHSVQSVDLTPFIASIESPSANTIANTGLKISATERISAYYEVNAANNREIFSLKGSKALGIDFYTPFQNFWKSGATTPASFSSVDIVATQNNTTVLITPKTAIVGHAANVTYSITLNAGQTYSMRETNITNPTKLSGSIVSANKPIAITLHSGALNNAGCLSTMGDQITNSSYLGKNHIVQRGTTKNDRVYVMAIENATTITFTNSTTSSTLINWGETKEYVLSTENLNYIQTNKPVYVWHAKGFGCNVSGAQVAPLYCAGEYSTSFSRNTTDSIGVMLTVRNGFQNAFKLNGNASLIPASAFNVVPGTANEFVAATIYFSITQVPLNSYNEVTNTGDIFGMAVTTGGSGTGGSYAYLSEFASIPFVTAGPDATICANSTLNLNGIVGGGSVTGKWSGTGFGSFQNPMTDLNNVYIPSDLDTLISPISLILTSTGPCSVRKDTILLTVQPAPLVNASVDQIVCVNNSEVQLNGAVSGGASTGIWTTSGTGSFLPNATTLNAKYIPTPADITNGSVTLNLTSTNAGICQNESDFMTITFSSGPSVNAGPDTLYVCSNNADVNLVGSVSGNTTTGKWSTSGNGIFSPDNSNMMTTYQSTTNDVNQGQVWIYLTSTNNGTCLKVVDSLLVQYTPAPVVDAGLNITACSNTNEVNLNGTVSGPTTTGQWSGGLGTFSPDDQSLNATYYPTAAEISNGTITLTLTTTNNAGCNSVSDNVKVVYVQPPFVNFNYTEECAGVASVFTDFSLPINGTLTNWNWDFGDGATATTNNANHAYNTKGTYSVTLIATNSYGCSDTVVKNVNAFESPVADFDYTLTCTDNDFFVAFTDQSTYDQNPINFWFYDYGGQGSAAVKDPTKYFFTPGDYTITHIVRNIPGCSDTIQKTITIPHKPKAGFYYNTSNGLNIGATFNFIDTSSYADSWFWTFGDGKTSTSTNTSNVYMANGTYTVTQVVYNTYGCTDTVSKVLIINTAKTEVSDLIPNAISPNGDGENDVWKLDFIQTYYPNATVDIFNQWGQLLFSSVGYKIPWNGTYHGEFVPDGTYFYIINLNDGKEDSLFKGTLLVLKNGN
ncbi:MAG: gliding motility-associated C-terminal domain-containing protein [Brumimicrobium sp.]|nr:gliding motility-associated C-terminal domain-containing protein [Brumimicrobium sp.]